MQVNALIFKTTRCFQGPVPKTTTPICHPQLVVHWTGTGWFEFFTHWKPSNGYGHVAMVCEHVWRMLCSVRSTGAHVVQPFFLFFVFEVSPALSSVVSTCCFTGQVRVGLKFPQYGNLTNRYAHVGMVHGNGWRMLCSVCTTDAHFARPFPCNS